MNRTTLGVLTLLVSAALVTACGSDTTAAGAASPPAAASPSQAASPSEAAATNITAKGAFVAAASADASTTAFAYDQQLVPPGAASEVTLTTHDGKTSVSLKVSGLLPKRTYGAHLHAKACGVDPKAAGSHFQHHPDPAATGSPSVDPAYANSENEVWLDFTTDSAGNASVTAEQPWVPTADRRPHSLVIHAQKTQTEAGKAGSAGARVACLTLPS